MRRALLTLVALALTSCGITAPPRDNAQWSTTTHDVAVTWRWTNPGGLGEYAGYAISIWKGNSCVVDIDPALSDPYLVRIAAHEYGHCAQARYLLPGIPRPDLGNHYASSGEGFAETYAQTYLRECGASLRPLGWADYREALCAQAPDPRLMKR